VLFAAVVVALAYGAWAQQAHTMRESAEASRVAVAKLKSDQIVTWLDERRGDAEVIRGDRLLASAVTDVLSGQADPGTDADVQNRLGAIRREYEYVDVVLVAPDGSILMRDPETESHDLGAPVEALVGKAARTRKVQASDLYLDGTGRARIMMVAPVLPGPPGTGAVATIVLHMDPDGFLYPVVQERALKSRTGETLLVERRGDRILFLSELRHLENTALKLTAPVDAPLLPAAEAVRGVEGVVEGIDYRGVPVLAALKRVPETPWYVVAKIDTAEVLDPIERRGWLTAGFTLLVVLLGAAGALLLWRARESQVNAELEQRVFDRTAELDAANKDLEAFAYSVSHDLRAPLRHISGFSSLLAERVGADLDEKSRHYVETISESVRTMGVLIDDLLQFSRTGRAELKIEDVDMAEVVAEALEPLRQATADRAIDWSVAPLPHVVGDHALLRQVWVNLLGNAAKYTQGRTPARIEVETHDSAEEHVFSVRDNGVGFDMDYVHKLFGVFQRLHSDDEFEGNGIGLANVQRIINRLGGKVWAEGEVGVGAVFFFSLPHRRKTSS
jgi:signal transduction histidine kinase